MDALVGISVDVDSVASHLQGYGITACPSGSCPVHELGVGRALELFAKHSAKATFFFVADSVKPYASVLREVAAAGHEIGCHSMTHHLPFDLTASALREVELLDAKRCLEDLSGSSVVGFRAPSWDLSEALLESLSEYGYSYDSSLYPSWAAYALRLSVRARSVGDGNLPRVPLPKLSTLMDSDYPHRR